MPKIAVKAVGFITQARLKEIRALRHRMERASERLDALTAECDPLEAETLALLAAGARIEDGPHTCAIRETGRTTVKWKVEFVTRLGDDLAEQIIRDTPEKTTQHLVVSIGGGK